ncbi:MAG: hypothetical protein AB9917_22700 [Negativicutes bacterium]
MKSKLIVMLTYHDQSVKDAASVFATCSDLPVEFWGFKDVGLPKEKMAQLVAMMKEAGKKTFLEVVSYSEAECMRGAKLAVELGFDYLMGTIFYPQVWAFLKDKESVYLPFVGKVSGSPSILEGSVKEIVDEALEYMKLGVKGFDILAYRHAENPERLAREFTAAIPGIVVIAGSIESLERMQFVEDIGAWAFTMGSALFDQQFVNDGSFRENLEQVIEMMNGIS